MKIVRGHKTTLRADLLSAGHVILKEDGIDALSLRAVARRANVSSMAPYRHFEDKQALLAAIAIEGYQKLRELCHNALSVEGNEAKVRAVSRWYFNFATEDPQMYHLIFSNHIKTVDDHPDLLAATDATNCALRRLMRELTSLEKANLAALSLWSLLHGFCSLYIDNEITSDLEPRAGQGKAYEILEEIIREWSSGVFAID